MIEAIKFCVLALWTDLRDPAMDESE